MEQGSYHVPGELDGDPALRSAYVQVCDALFAAYEETIDGLLAHLRSVTPRGENERDTAYNLRLRRVATDAARFLLPAATLTNVGVTLNARSMEHAVRKLLSSPLAEEREIGESLKEESRKITPTLIKYADYNEYIALTRAAQAKLALSPEQGGEMDDCRAELVHYDPQAERKLAAALLYRFSPMPYAEVWQSVEGMERPALEAIVHEALDRLGPHDIPLRELEVVDYTFDLVMDYGAYREFKRHRMQTYLAQPPTVDLGYVVPDVAREAGLEQPFRDSMETARQGYARIAEVSPDAAAYLVTHAHLRRVLSKLNLRECYHLFKLRTSPQAHFTLRRVMRQALDLASQRHPLLFRYLRLRE